VGIFFHRGWSVPGPHLGEERGQFHTRCLLLHRGCRRRSRHPASPPQRARGRRRYRSCRGRSNCSASRRRPAPSPGTCSRRHRRMRSSPPREARRTRRRATSQPCAQRNAARRPSRFAIRLRDGHDPSTRRALCCPGHRSACGESPLFDDGELGWMSEPASDPYLAAWHGRVDRGRQMGS